MRQPGLPNILWIIAEDFGPALSCYGRRDLATPHIDRLAADGILYRNCFTTAPVCSPSRSAFMTGMYQTTLGSHHHRSHRNDFHPLPTGVRIASDWFRDAGYRTGNVKELPLDFKGTGKTDWNFASVAKPFDTDHWDELTRGDVPFFGMVNLWETHRRFDAPLRTDPRLVDLPPYYPDHPEVRADYARYLDSAIALDLKVGALLDQLRRQRLHENTVVFFMGDNGEAHVRAKQFCYEEGLHVPLVIRIPEQFRRSLGIVNGARDELVEAIDWLPTALGFARRSPAGPMQGRNILGPNRGRPRAYVFGARDRCDETEICLRTVRDLRYRLIVNLTPDKGLFEPNAYKADQYPAWNLIQQLGHQGRLEGAARTLTEPKLPRIALFDLKTDPHQTTNVAEAPGFGSHRTRLLHELHQHLKRSRDPELHRWNPRELC